MNKAPPFDEALVRQRLKTRHRVALNVIKLHSWAPNVLMYFVREKLMMVDMDKGGNLMGTSQICHGLVEQ